MTAWFLSLFAILLGLLLFSGVVLAVTLLLRRNILSATVVRRLIVFVLSIVIVDVFFVSRSDPRRLETKAVLRVTAVAHKTWWELRYAGFAAANELHVPADETIAMHVLSDRRHLFLAGGGAVVRDSFFTRDTTILLRAHEGTWRARDFSGDHFALPLTIVAERKPDFDRWLTRQRSDAQISPASSSGAAVFATARCTFCHSVRGLATAEEPIGPDLTHLGSRATIAGGLLPNRSGYLAGWVVDAEALKPGCGMPRNAMPPRRLHALLEFLGHLQ